MCLRLLVRTILAISVDSLDVLPPLLPKNQRFRKGVGKRGLATNNTQNTAKLVPQNYVLPFIRGHRKKGAEERPESTVWEGFPCVNPLCDCPPTPFRNL